MSTSTNSQIPAELTHKLDQIAQHDVMIERLDGRMTGVEQGLHSAVSMIKEMRDASSKGFADLTSSIAAMKSEQGPGIGKLLVYLLSGAGLMGAASGAITILVTSFISPQITDLTTTVKQHKYVLEQLDRDMRDELRDYRRSDSRRAEDRMKRMEERMGWGAELKRAEK